MIHRLLRPTFSFLFLLISRPGHFCTAAVSPPSTHPPSAVSVFRLLFWFLVSTLYWSRVPWASQLASHQKHLRHKTERQNNGVNTLISRILQFKYACMQYNCVCKRYINNCCSILGSAAFLFQKYGEWGKCGGARQAWYRSSGDGLISCVHLQWASSVFSVFIFEDLWSAVSLTSLLLVERHDRRCKDETRGNTAHVCLVCLYVPNVEAQMGELIHDMEIVEWKADTDGKKNMPEVSHQPAPTADLGSVNGW